MTSIELKYNKDWGTSLYDLDEMCECLGIPTKRVNTELIAALSYLALGKETVYERLYYSIPGILYFDIKAEKLTYMDIQTPQ
jgi:hypothetical protein